MQADTSQPSDFPDLPPDLITMQGEILHMLSATEFQYFVLAAADYMDALRRAESAEERDHIIRKIHNVCRRIKRLKEE